MTTHTITWRGTMTATSSIAHGGETRGTHTLLRREVILQPETHRPLHIPVISGNSFRGLLRRTGEELLRETLCYDHQLPLPVAHALRSGGSLVKSSREPLSGRSLAELRDLIPQIGVFGAAGGGRIIDGCLQVGKVVPLYRETAHITPGHPTAGASLPAAFDSVQLETYVRHDDTDTHAGATLLNSTRTPVDADGRPDLDALDGLTTPPAPSITDTSATGGASQLMRFSIETYPAGTTFSTWLHLAHASPIEAAFFVDVLERYRSTARLGGRAAIGHGTVTCNLEANAPAPDTDWRAHVTENRAAALDALGALQ